jgi:hypothetical protein
MELDSKSDSNQNQNNNIENIQNLIQFNSSDVDKKIDLCVVNHSVSISQFSQKEVVDKTKINTNNNSDINLHYSNNTVNNTIIFEKPSCNICILKNQKYCYLDNKNYQILKIKDINDKKFKLKIDENSNSEINYIMELSDGRLLICNLDYDIKIIKIDYVTKNYEFTNILQGHKNLITKVVELKNGKLCSCSFDGYIKLWKKNNDNSYEFEMDLFLFKEGKFYSLLEINEKIFSLLNYNNKNFLYIMDLKKKEENIKILENINLKRENLIKLDDNNLIIGGYNVIYIYDINKKEEIKIDCDYIICSLYLLKDKGILFGDNKGNLVKIKNIFNFQVIFKKENKDIKDEIDSLGEFNNNEIIYKNNNLYYKFAKITYESK